MYLVALTAPLSTTPPWSELEARGYSTPAAAAMVAGPLANPPEPATSTRLQGVATGPHSTCSWASPERARPSAVWFIVTIRVALVSEPHVMVPCTAAEPSARTEPVGATVRPIELGGSGG